MLATILIPLALAGGFTPDPIDPETEVAIVEASWDPTLCPMVEQVVSLLGPALDYDFDLALDLIVAYSVEEFEDGYGQNLTEEGEDALIELIEGCWQ